MRLLAIAAIRSGIIDESTINQFKRWGVVDRDLDTSIIEDPDDAIEGIQFALESEEQVRLQSTDLDLLKFYLDKNNQRKGQMVVHNADASKRAVRTVTYAVRARGKENQYIIPWVSDSIEDTLTNGKSYLRFVDGEKSTRVYFTNIEELYFGEVKAFMVCEGLEET